MSLDDYPIDPEHADWEVYASERLAEEQAMVTAALAITRPAGPITWGAETRPSV